MKPNMLLKRPPSRVDSGSKMRTAALTAIASQRVAQRSAGGGGGLLGAAMAAAAEAATAAARVTSARMANPTVTGEAEMEVGAEADVANETAQPEPAGLLQGLAEARAQLAGSSGRTWGSLPSSPGAVRTLSPNGDVAVAPPSWRQQPAPASVAIASPKGRQPARASVAVASPTGRQAALVKAARATGAGKPAAR